MITISRDSWHYKLARIFMHDQPPSNSLCLYFWQVMGGCFISLCLVAGALLISLFLLSPIIMLFFPNFSAAGTFVCVVYLLGACGYLLNQLYKDTSKVTFVRVTAEFLRLKRRRSALLWTLSK